MNLPARLLLVVGIFVLAAGYWLTDFDAHFAFFGGWALEAYPSSRCC